MLTSRSSTQLRSARSVSMTEEIDHQQLVTWLIAVAEKRDKVAFTHLFKFFAPKIQRIATSKFTNEALSNEVVQETMTNVWRKAHLYSAEKGAPTTWVYTVMRNVTFDLLRKQKSKKEDNLSDDIWPMVEAAQVEEQPFDDHLQSKQILDYLDLLPENQKQVIKGFYFMEMSQEQLAEHLDLPLGTVKSRLRLALNKLRKQIGEQL
ncbi:sigma-70 family RNA polymerase sigma factor [Thalassotalea ponticola]|uniref:sigma-70 family RNA polymerase sigma factor n=2 Tax=Thalassotalea ponticola TaxID=1523392 RepID=UPI0025B55B51|nr:sigma-70 family RNA polymerase sigma factor [Thalassotalea ponticola]MDN3651933.1 sigma-70 family RNA polymerase sigma factor [Thalassotalea ponticola]